VINRLRALRERIFAPHAHISYAQSGEDLIARHLLIEVLGRRCVRYLEIGAHEPWFLSNTALFYRMGGHGVLVEPDEDLCRNLRRHRPRDICIQAGIGDGQTQEGQFYVLSARTLSTFSANEARQYVEGGYRIERTVDVPLLSVNELIGTYFATGLEFVSIDVEGLDYEVLQSFDFSNCRPDVFCIETVRHSSERRKWRKRPEIVAVMQDKGYFVYADTFVNTIFTNQDVW
jgi:FkbM family methyltransferase